MSLHYFSISKRMRSNMLQRATSKDVVRFDILFKWEIVMVNLGPPVIQFSKMMGESGTLPVKSMRVPRSELGSEDAMLSAMTPFLNCVPEAWRAEMTEELTSLARSLNGQLSHLGKPVSLVVEVRAKILSVVKCREGDGPLDHLFEKLTALAKADPYRTLSEPATLSSLEALEAVSADQFETDDRCSICTEEYVSGGSSEVVCMPCSHAYHRHCIIEWLRRNHVCPICRFQMPHEVIIYIRELRLS
ncbi:RING-H2 finger protein ATL22-like [Punica granatum]|uniref:Uncharacterized protein n=2 Tax=Punica granatum TaxID=22663 RepID=A0A2I0IT48_PUNGR|nr:RING-H2 finger protein ATL22-like [Punica granatum]PKI47185.1 hypothetical protein CRG98_032407 [Punica granatum]